MIALVLGLSEQNRILTEQIAALQARVVELEARLDVPPKTPSNSSLPPSRGQKANIRTKGKKRRRKGKGRPGTTRKLAENPDKVRDIFATTCCHCSHTLAPGDQVSGDVHAYDHIDPGLRRGGFYRRSSRW